MQLQSLGWEDTLEQEMATLSSILAWKIPWSEESGRLQSMGWKGLNTTEHMCTHKLNIPLIFLMHTTVEDIKSNTFREQTGSIHISNDKWVCLWQPRDCILEKKMATHSGILA